MSEQQLPFDEAVAQKVLAALQPLFLQHPELRSLAVAFDWRGDLNDAKIRHGLWVGPDGQVNTLDGIFGSINQTFKLLDWQMGQAFKAKDGLQRQVTQLAREVVARGQENAAVDRGGGVRRPEAAQGEVPPQDPPGPGG